MEAEFGPLLDAELIHPALTLDRQSPANGGWRVVVSEAVAAGTVLLRTHGALAGNTSIADAVAAVHGEKGTAEEEAIATAVRARLQHLHPRVLEDCPEHVHSRVGSATVEDPDFQWLRGRLSDDELRLLLMRMECNTFDLGLYPHASFFNHSCVPTAQGFAVPDAAGPTIEVVAIADVATGGEVTVSYLSDHELCLPTDQRQAKLQPYGFACGCSRCTTTVYGTSEGVLCPTCGHGVCVYRPAEEGGSGDVYTCSVPYHGGTPCGLDHPPEPIDATIVACFQAASGAAAVQESGSELAAACEALTSVTATLPPEHWIATIAATNLSRLFCSGPAMADARRTHGRHWVAAELGLLSAAETALQPLDYAVSNQHERLAEAWQTVRAVLAEDDRAGTLTDSLLLWRSCAPHSTPYPTTAAECDRQVKRHTEETRRIRDVVGWH